MTNINLKNSIGLRLIIIAVLAVLLLIPSFWIMVLIKERQERRDNASVEISSKWGNQQTITGPILTIPYNYFAKTENGDPVFTEKYAHFLPNDLSVYGQIFPEIRYRGIYEEVLFRTQLTFSGNFSPPDFNEFNILAENIIWEGAFFSIGVTDMKGINDQIILKWKNQELIPYPGSLSQEVVTSGVSVKVPVEKDTGRVSFSFEIDLNGSQNLSFVPVGSETKVNLSSAWTNPSFIGDYLPDQREVNSDGFEAQWKILSVNRNFPQKWIDSEFDSTSSEFGVSLLRPVDEYQKNMRTSKYAIMFIALTFLSFFMIELLGEKVIHPIQYIFIGLALLIFYTLLLSLSEHIGFAFAYLIASLAIIFLISIYTKSILSNNLQSIIIFSVLSVLFGYLYIVLQLQDFALLMGSLGLFVILSIVMFITRNIDWFSILKSEEKVLPTGSLK